MQISQCLPLWSRNRRRKNWELYTCELDMCIKVMMRSEAKIWIVSCCHTCNRDFLLRLLSLFHSLKLLNTDDFEVLGMLSIEKHWTHTLLQTSRNYQTILTDDGGVSEEQQGVTQHHGGEQSVCTRYDLHRLDKYNRWDAPERARVVASWRTGAFPLSHWSPGHVVVVLLRIRQPISIAFLLYCDTHQVMMNLVACGNHLFREGVGGRENRLWTILPSLSHSKCV